MDINHAAGEQLSSEGIAKAGCDTPTTTVPIHRISPAREGDGPPAWQEPQAPPIVMATAGAKRTPTLSGAGAKGPPISASGSRTSAAIRASAADQHSEERTANENSPNHVGAKGATTATTMAAPRRALAPATAGTAKGKETNGGIRDTTPPRRTGGEDARAWRQPQEGKEPDRQATPAQQALFRTASAPSGTGEKIAAPPPNMVALTRARTLATSPAPDKPAVAVATHLAPADSASSSAARPIVMPFNDRREEKGSWADDAADVQLRPSGRMASAEKDKQQQSVVSGTASVSAGAQAGGSFARGTHSANSSSDCAQGEGGAERLRGQGSRKPGEGDTQRPQLVSTFGGPGGRLGFQVPSEPRYSRGPWPRVSTYPPV